MRTKTLLLTAALTAAGTLASMAQVYSVNIVGYINLNIPAGYSMIANQLNNSPDNSLASVIPTAPDSTTVYKFNAATGGYTIDNFIEGVGWSGDTSGAMTLNPGEGVFINAPSLFTATFVGEVQLVSATAIAPSYSIMSSAIPQSGAIDTDLGWSPIDSDTVYQFNHATGGYLINNYIDGVGWTGDSGGSSPVLSVGEAFFVLNPSSLRSWNRTFSVGP